MSIRLRWILLGLVFAWGCNQGGSHGYSKPPANSYNSMVVQLRIDGQPISVDGARVSPKFWNPTEVKPVIGRLFRPEEYARQGPRVVMLSHDLWEESFNSEPATVGRAIELDGAPAIVVGILPPGFRFPEATRLWVPRASGSKHGS
jgi:hypothetical protein